MKLRSYLIALTLAAVLPLAVFAAAIGAFVLDQQRETFRRGAHDRAWRSSRPWTRSCTAIS
jgi:hypothetical protein